MADPFSRYMHYDITSMLCTYINEQKKIANGKDLLELCNLKVRNEDLQISYQSLNSKYNDSLRQVLESKKKEIELTLRNNEIEKENAELKRKIDIQSKNLIDCGFRL